MKTALVCALLLLASCQGAGERDVLDQELEQVPPLARALPQFQAPLEALLGALKANEDEHARAILGRMWALGPDQATSELLQSFERILAGRESVKAVEWRLETHAAELPAELQSAVPTARGFALRARLINHTDERLELRPGPATIETRREELSKQGAITRGVELRPFEFSQALILEPQAQLEVPLAEFFLAPREQESAVRLSFALELRSGVLLRGGRELPAMRWQVQPVRQSALDASLGARIAPEDLVARLASSDDARELLRWSARVDDTQGAQALALLAQALERASRVDLERFSKALAWLCGERVPDDAPSIARWLAQWQAPTPKPDLVLRPQRSP